MGYYHYGVELFIQMIKFSQERLRKSTSKTAKGLGHTLETWESHVSALQNGKQGCPAVFYILGANGNYYWVWFCLFFIKNLVALAFNLVQKEQKFLPCFMVRKIQVVFCHWGLTSLRQLGWHLFGKPAEKQNDWIWGRNCTTLSIIPFRKKKKTTLNSTT